MVSRMLSQDIYDPKPLVLTKKSSRKKTLKWAPIRRQFVCEGGNGCIHSTVGKHVAVEYSYYCEEPTCPYLRQASALFGSTGKRHRGHKLE